MEGDAMWAYIQDEILGMGWLNRLIGWMLSLTGLDMEGRIGKSILVKVASKTQGWFPAEKKDK